MGRGSYTAADWKSLRSTRNLNVQQDATKIFAKTKPQSAFSSKDVAYREACDIDETTESTPIIIGFDVTASMGYLAKELATNSIHNTITTLLTQNTVPSPQILCAAIGDCKSDEYPLQVTQFESDIRIVTQLLDLFLEGGGGGNNGESYNLLWYFAAKHTKLHSFEKRNKKGYIFTIGNDKCHNGLNEVEIAQNFKEQSCYPISNDIILAQAKKKYNIFHIHIDEGNASDNEIFSYWSNLMPGSCTRISKKDITYLADLITAIITINEGNSAGSALSKIDQYNAERIAYSISLINQPKDKATISF